MARMADMSVLLMVDAVYLSLYQTVTCDMATHIRKVKGTVRGHTSKVSNMYDTL